MRKHLPEMYYPHNLENYAIAGVLCFFVGIGCGLIADLLFSVSEDQCFNVFLSSIALYLLGVGFLYWKDETRKLNSLVKKYDTLKIYYDEGKVPEEKQDLFAKQMLDLRDFIKKKDKEINEKRLIKEVKSKNIQGFITALNEPVQKTEKISDYVKKLESEGFSLKGEMK